MMENTPNRRIDLIIPACNEEASLPLVLAAIPKVWVRNMIVCDNGSTDRTAELARAAGATVVFAEKRGYGSACLAGIRYLENLPASEQPEILVFLDGDFSDYPEDLPKVAGPILNGETDLVIGSRLLGRPEPGAMTLPQRFGNWLAPLLIRWLYGYRFTDLGPFRAIRWACLPSLNLQDANSGWTVEMQVRAVQNGLKCTEVPVRYRKRAAGNSKISGDLKGMALAAWKIISTIIILRLKHRRSRYPMRPVNNQA